MEIEQQTENNSNNKMEIEEQKQEQNLVQHQQFIYGYDYDEEEEKQKELEQIKKKLTFQIKLKQKDLIGKKDQTKIKQLFAKYIHSNIIKLKIELGEYQEINYKEFGILVAELQYLIHRNILDNLRYFELIIEPGNFPGPDAINSIIQELKGLKKLNSKKIIIKEEKEVVSLDFSIEKFKDILDKSYVSFQFYLKNNFEVKLEKGILQLIIPQNLFFNQSRLQIILKQMMLLNQNYVEKLIIKIGNNNELGYNYYQDIHEIFKRFNKIKYLQIEIGKGNGASVPLIFQNQYFKQLTGLKILIGSGSQKSSNDFNYITDFISKCGQKLNNLEIEIGNNNNLKETSVLQLSQALAKQQELRNLVIKIGQYNKIKDQSLALLGQALSHTKIQSFSLTLDGYNDIKHSGIGGLFYKWGCFQYIKQFQLDLGLNNNMGSLGLIGMGKALQKMKKLQQLSITFRKKNIKNIQDFIHLLANLKHLKQIRYLKLIIREENEIGYEGALAISHCIQNIPNLIGVHLNFGGANTINKDGFYQIYKGIQNCQNLQSLEFYQKDDIIWGQKDFQVLVDLLRDPIFTFIKVNDSILFTYNFMDITMIMDLDETNMYDLDHSIIQKFRVFRKFKFGLTSWTNKNQNQLSGLVNVFLNNTSNIPQFNLIFGDAEEYSPILIYKSLPPVQAIQPAIEFENQKKWKEDYKMVSEFFDDDFGDVLAIYINFYRLCLKINDPNFSHNQFLSNLVTTINTTMAKKLSLKILALIPEGDVNGRFLNVLSGVFNEMLLLVRPESYLEKIVIESLDNFYIEYQKDKYFEIVYDTKHPVQQNHQLIPNAYFNEFYNNCLVCLKNNKSFVFCANSAVILHGQQLQQLYEIIMVQTELQNLEIGVVFQEYQDDDLQLIFKIMNQMKNFYRLTQFKINMNLEQFQTQEQEPIIEKIRQVQTQSKNRIQERKNLIYQINFLITRYRKLFRKDQVKDMCMQLFGIPKYREQTNVWYRNQINFSRSNQQ